MKHDNSFFFPFLLSPEKRINLLLVDKNQLQGKALIRTHWKSQKKLLYENYKAKVM